MYTRRPATSRKKTKKDTPEEDSSSDDEQSDMEDRRSWWKRFERPGVYKKAPGIDPSKVKKESLSTGSLHSMRMWWKTHGTRPSCQAEATESSGSARAASKNGVKVMGKN